MIFSELGDIKAIRWNNAATDADTSNEKTYLYNYNRNQWLTEAQFGSSDGNATFNKHEPSVTLNTEVKNTETLTKTAQQQVVLKPGFHAKQGSTVTLSIEPSGASFTPSEDYKVDQLTYDANGNIQSLRRNQSSSNGNRAMDDLTYHYNTEKPNQLQQVTDAVTASTNAGDITSQYSTENYEYNSIGQLVRNNAEGINYTYNASGLVTEVNSRYVSVQFYYNDRNQRVRKVVSRNGQRPVTTVYVRDAAGTPMAIYRNGTLVEHTVYGASRLGVYKRQGNATYKTSYELTDHLGNVRAVVSHANTSAITGTDYYPFGMPMPLRNSLSDYRYAYQGQEKDPETGKEAFQLRLWDARIGRWLTTDPYGQYHSPYLGMGNDPINGIDPDGGYRTAIGAFFGWVGSGFKGSIHRNANATGNERYALHSSRILSNGGGVEFSIKYGGDLQESMRDGAASINSAVTNFTQPARDFTQYASNAVSALPDPYLDLNLNFDIGVGAGLKTPFGKIEAAILNTEIGQIGFSSIDGAYAEWGDGSTHNFAGAKLKLLNNKLALGAKVDYFAQTRSHGMLHYNIQLGPGKSLGLGLPNGLSGGKFSAKLNSKGRNISFDVGGKFIFGVKGSVTLGLK